MTATCLIPVALPASRTNTVLAFAKTMACDTEAFGLSGGRPSYLSASLASLSKLGVWGRRWKCAGLSAVCGVAGRGTPSIQTCCGVASRARGWLSHRTMSRGDINGWWTVRDVRSAYTRRTLTMQRAFSIQISRHGGMFTFFEEPNVVVQSENRRWRGGHGRQRKVVREAVVIRLLHLEKEETRV